MILLKNTKKYEQIAEMIEEMIIDSDFKIGDRLPSVNNLCDLFNVAPATMCNSLEQLRDRGIINSIPRKGNFINKLPEPEVEYDRETADFLEHCSPVSSIFSPRAKTLKVLAEEYRIPIRKRYWDRLIAGFQKYHPGIRFKMIIDPNHYDEADVILSSHAYWAGTISESPEAIDQLFSGIDFSEYFPSALATPYPERKFANLPIAVSQQLRLWNCQLVEEHCPGIITDFPQNIITHIINNYDYQDPDFPIVGSFIHFFPLVFMEEGIDIYDPETGRVNFNHPRIPEILIFNRCMFQKMASRPEWPLGELRVDYIWKAFAQGDIMALDTFSYALSIIPENPSFGIKVQTATIERHQGSTAVPQTLGIGIKCQDLELASKFIQFVCRKPGQKILAESKCNIPAFRSVAEQEGFLSRCPNNMDSLLKDLYQPDSVLTKFEIFDHAQYDYLQNFIIDYMEGTTGLPETMELLKKSVKSDEEQQVALAPS